MKNLIRILILMSCISSIEITQAQNVLSRTKWLAVAIKTKEGAISFNGVQLKSLIISGPERSIANFIFASKEITQACNCLLLDREGCLRSLNKNGMVKEISPLYRPSMQEITLRIPPDDPKGYNDLLASFLNKTNPKTICTSDFCTTLCTSEAEVCYSVQCNNEGFDVCYDGDFTIKGTNNHVTVEAKMN